MLDTGLIDLVTRLTRQEARGEFMEARMRQLEGVADQMATDRDQRQREIANLRARLDALEARG